METSLQPYQIRVFEEKTELDSKLEKLKIFLDSKAANTIPKPELTRLQRQKDVMRAYSDILKERIGAFFPNTKAERERLDQAYQDAFKEAPAEVEGEWMPPCPRCAGKMESWDGWLVTGAQCTQCGWGMSEGSGCLV